MPSQLPAHDLTAPTQRRSVDHGWVAAGAEGIAVFLEKVEGSGEDAPPLHLTGSDGDWKVVAVADGLGGAGSARREVAGSAYTEAFLAANLARTLLALAEGRTVLAEAERLQRWLARAFELFDERIPSVESGGIRGRMRRSLPTTFAVADVVSDESGHRVRARWTGDSRALLLRPDVGLQALTEDHVRQPDPLVQLINDSPLSNVVSRSAPFFVDEHEVHVAGPCIVVVATDGVFGYVRSPGELEHHLLDALVTSSDPSSWAEGLAARIGAYTADDASLALAIVGFDGFDDVRRCFEARAAEVRRDQFEPLEQAVTPESLRAERAAAWERYAPSHRGLLAAEG